MTRELAEQIHFSEQATLSDFVGQINDLRDEDVYKRQGEDGGVFHGYIPGR